MVESFEPTPINPDNQASDETQQLLKAQQQAQLLQTLPMQNFPIQNQPLAPLQNRPGHLLNVSQQLQFASQNGMAFNQNNLLAAQVNPALFAQTGPLLNNYQGVSDVCPPHLQPMQNNICPNPYNVNQKPMGYPPIPTGMPGPMNLVPNFHQPNFATHPMAANMNPNMAANVNPNMNQNINVMAMNAAQMGLNVSPDAGLPSPFTNDSTRPKPFETALDIVASTAQQSQEIMNQDIGQKLDHLTQKIQGIQEQLKKHALLEASRASERATKRKHDGSSSDSDDQSSNGRKLQSAKKLKSHNRYHGLREESDGSASDSGSISSGESKRRPSKKKKARAPSDGEDIEEEEDLEEEDNDDSKTNPKSNKKWEKLFKLLQRFSKREGHCNVYRYHEEDGEKLGMWLCRQRIYHKQGGLDPKLARRLEQVGVVWSVSHAEKMMNLMYQYKMREGNCEVPRFHVEDGMKLGIWLQDQKQQRKRNNLSEERIYRLNKLGIIWDIHDDRWMKMYNLWLEYIQNQGHPNVPRSYVVNGQKLGMWLHTQRKFKKRGAMIDKRSDLLEKAGIVWDVLKECNTKAYVNGMYRDENGRTRRKR